MKTFSRPRRPLREANRAHLSLRRSNRLVNVAANPSGDRQFLVPIEPPPRGRLRQAIAALDEASGHVYYRVHIQSEMDFFVPGCPVLLGPLPVL